MLQRIPRERADVCFFLETLSSGVRSYPWRSFAARWCPACIAASWIRPARGLANHNDPPASVELLGIPLTSPHTFLAHSYYKVNCLSAPFLGASSECFLASGPTAPGSRCGGARGTHAVRIDRPRRSQLLNCCLARSPAGWLAACSRLQERY